MLDFYDSQVRITAIKLIKWLKMGHNRNTWVAQEKRNMHRPLVLDYTYDWCRDIKKLVTEDVGFSKMFSISDCKLQWKLRG